MLRFLFEHRIRGAGLNAASLRWWAKRLVTLPALFRHWLASRSLQLKGAHIDPSAVISHLVVHGDPRNLRIGGYTSIGRVEIQCDASVTIGNCVAVNDGVRILSGSHDVTSPDWVHVCRPITIRDHVWIATGAMVLQGVTIGEGAVVAACSVVTRDVPPFTIVAGNPARMVKKRELEGARYKPATWFAAFEAWLGQS